ncbi:MAG: BMP family ABC transporter substrate-binding protein [Comamonadaceae bacterium]|nr:BMP family ABC transporter substrate-binding protein [Comamonadaceae bacterium]
MRKYLFWLAGLAALNVGLLLVGSGVEPDGRCRQQLCVGLVFDVGGLGDKSFNDAAYLGLVRAQRELGAAVRFIEPGDGSDRESALRELASQGYQLVFGVGFIYSDDLRKLAAEFPGTHFAGIDFSRARRASPRRPTWQACGSASRRAPSWSGPSPGWLPEAASWASWAACRSRSYGSSRRATRPGSSTSCPECLVLSAYAGTDPRAFSDPVTGKELALTQYGRGADVIYHAAGKTGGGVFNAARARSTAGPSAWTAISTDEAPGCVLTSMVKRVDLAVAGDGPGAGRGALPGRGAGGRPGRGSGSAACWTTTTVSSAEHARALAGG